MYIERVYGTVDATLIRDQKGDDETSWPRRSWMRTTMGGTDPKGPPSTVSGVVEDVKSGDVWVDT